MQKITVKGKHRSPVEAYVASLPFEQVPIFQFSDAWDIMVDHLAKIYSPVMDRRDVVAVLLEAFFAFENAHAPDGRVFQGAKERLREELIESLIEALATYPRSYRVSIPLPQFGRWPDGRHEFSPTSALVVERGRASLQFSTVGYANNSADSRVALEVFAKTKQFVLLLHAMGMATSREGNTGAVATIDDLDQGVSTEVRVPDPLARCLDGFSIGGLELWSEEDAALKAEATADLEKRLEGARKFFRKADLPELEPLSVAIEWHEDSRFGQNQTVAFLSACIGLEAVLGDADEQMRDMSSRLVDRFAYLIGRNRDERLQLAKAYQRILRLRGQLVHSKQARLRESERPVLDQAQSMLRRVIQHELFPLLRV